MPRILRGRDITWQFDTPITIAAERALKVRSTQWCRRGAGRAGRSHVTLNVDMHQATRDTIDGGGAPAKWLFPVDQVKKLRQRRRGSPRPQRAADQVAQGADIATRVAGAAESAGDAAQALQGAF